jgi:hypothetical protein
VMREALMILAPALAVSIALAIAAIHCGRA